MVRLLHASPADTGRCAASHSQDDGSRNGGGLSVQSLLQTSRDSNTSRFRALSRARFRVVA